MHSVVTPYRNDISYPPFCKTMRRIQLVICVVCSIVAVALLVIVSSFTVACIILAATCFAFLLITLVDFLGSLRNVQYPSVIWLGIAILGALMFFVSAGLTVWGTSFMCIIAAVLSVLTGCAFLAEAVYILWRLKKAHVNMVASSTKSKSSIAVTEEKEPKTPPDELSGTQSSFLTLGTQKSKLPGYRNTEIMTYGGTFHMSKDSLPLPSPVTHQGNDRRSMTQVDDFGCQVKHESQSQDMYTQDKITQDRITQDDMAQRCTMPDMVMYEQSNRRLSSVARLRPEDQVAPFVEHHYNQTPCACGYTHFQSSTIVKGAIRQHPQDTIQDHQQQIEHQMQQTRLTCRSQNQPVNEYDIQPLSRAPDSKQPISRTKIMSCEIRRKESDTLRFCVPNPENVNIKMKPFLCSKRQHNRICKSKPCEDKSNIPRRIPAAKRETIKTRDKDQITDQSVMEATCQCDLEPTVHSYDAVPEKQDEYKCPMIEERERTPPEEVVAEITILPPPEVPKKMHRCMSGCPCGSPVEDAKLQSSSCSPSVKSEKPRCSNSITVRPPRFSQDSQGPSREDQKSLSKRCMVLEKTSRPNDSKTCHSKFPTVVQGTTKKYGCSLLSEKPYHPDSPVVNQMRNTPKYQGTTQTQCLSKTNEASQGSVTQRQFIPDPAEVVIEVSELQGTRYNKIPDSNARSNIGQKLRSF